MSKDKKSNAPKAGKPLTEALQKLVATVSTCGFSTANAYAECVDAVRAIVSGTRLGSPRNRALEAAALGYKAGYVARSLLADAAYQKKWGNMSQLQQIEAGAEIIGRAAPTSSKDDRRTEQEHKACRAADVSWFKVRERAGLAEPKKNKGGRKPRPGSNAKEEGAANGNDAPKLSLAAPKLETPEAANTYYASAIAALLATADVNADATNKAWSDFIADTYQRAVKAKLIPAAE